MMRDAAFAAVLAASIAAAAHASPAELPNGAVVTPNSEVGRDQPVATGVSSLRAKWDMSCWRRVKDLWTWEDWPNPDADRPAPADFLEAANSPEAPVLEYRLGAWMYASQYWPDGKLKYDAGHPPGGETAVELRFRFAAMDRDGETELYRFGAKATRASATDTTLVDWRDVNPYVRMATVDGVDRRIASATNGLRSVEGAARPLPKYLHCLPFDDPYKADAEAWYESLAPDAMNGACSAVRRGNALYRNYDWKFDGAAEFVVRMSAAEGRHASVGVASLGAALAEDEVASGVYSAKYRALPGMTLDGINDAGVVAEINVDGGPGDGWHGTGDGSIHILGAVRWALDNGESAAQVAAHLADNVRRPAGDMNFHFMVADATETYIVENGDAHILGEFDHKVLTNYTLYDDEHAGGGKKRYGLLAGGADISSVHWTLAYQEGNDWDDDFDSPEQHADAIRQWADQGDPGDREARRGKTTAGGAPWWQTVHTSIYDFTAKTLKVAVQESGEYSVFAVDAVGMDDAAVREIIQDEIPHDSDGIVYHALNAENANRALDLDDDGLWTRKVDSRTDARMTARGYTAEWKSHVDDGKRDLTNNACANTEFTEWTCSPELPEGFSIIWKDGTDADEGWTPVIGGAILQGRPKGDINSTSLSWDAGDWSGGYVFTATRSAVCRQGELYVTPSFVTNAASSASVTNAGAVAESKAYADGKFLPQQTESGTYLSWNGSGLLFYGPFAFLAGPGNIFLDGAFDISLPDYLAGGTWNTGSDPFARMSDVPDVPDWALSENPPPASSTADLVGAYAHGGASPWIAKVESAVGSAAVTNAGAVAESRDYADGAFLSLAGGRMTGDLDMSVSAGETPLKVKFDELGGLWCDPDTVAGSTLKSDLPFEPALLRVSAWASFSLADESQSLPEYLASGDWNDSGDPFVRRSGARSCPIAAYASSLSAGEVRTAVLSSGDSSFSLALGTDASLTAEAFLWVTNPEDYGAIVRFSGAGYTFLGAGASSTVTSGKKALFTFFRVSATDVIVRKEEF